MTTHLNARRTRIRRLMSPVLISAVVAGLLVTGSPPSGATPPAPVILNSAGPAHWLESDAVSDDHDSTGNRSVTVTFLVNHPAGRTITGIVRDTDYNGSDNTGSIGPTSTASQTVNGFTTSRVVHTFVPPRPGGFSCPTLGGATRRLNAPLRFRVVDNTGERSAAVSANVHFVETDDCFGRTDYPDMYAQSQNKAVAVPGETVTFTFRADDADNTGTNDHFDKYRWRWRRLNDGATSGLICVNPGGDNDNDLISQNVSFPSRGRYVVEAELGGESDGCGDLDGAGNFFRMGAVDVNHAASTLSGSMAFAGPAVRHSNPPSVNAGENATAVANVADSGGAVQRIDWDDGNDGIFDRTERRDAFRSLDAVVQNPVSGSQLQESVNTVVPGLRTVRARITDSGATDIVDLSASSSLVRSMTFTSQLRINAIPSASSGSKTTNEDTPATILLAGNDADNQPEALTYEIVSAMPASQGSLSAFSGNHVTFRPAPNFNGSTSFTFRTRDGGPNTVAAWAHSNVATVFITVVPVNDAPTVNPASIVTNEDTDKSVQVTGNDVENGSNLTYSVAGQPTHGSALCTPTGLCTYSPDENFFGADSFVVRGTDSGGLSATATVSVTVNPVNDAPVADDQTISVPEDSENFPIALAATDVDSINLMFTSPIDDVDHGTLSCLGSACTYSPASDYTGSDSFTFRVHDNSGGSDTGTVTINVTPVNDAPVATDVDDAVTNEDVPLPLTLGGTDVDGDPVTLSGVDDPANGTTTLDGPNQVTYTPDTQWFGVDLFDFVVTDGNNEFDTGTVTVTVHPVNDAPTLVDQAFTVDEDSTTLLSVEASDVDGDALSWSVVSGPANGRLSGTGPDVAYQPSLNFHGADSFVIRVEDPGGLSDTATIAIAVLPVNDAPVADAMSVDTDEDTQVTVTLLGADVDGDALSFAAPVEGPSNGNVSCTGATCDYMPHENFNGSDLFTYMVTDPDGASDSASVSITVAPVNDAPVADAASVTTPEDTAIGIDVSASDADGDVLAYSIVVAPEHGTVGGIAPNLVFDPDPNYHGPDSFVVAVDDGTGGSDTATISVDVLPVNDAPMATGGTVSTPEDTGVAFQLGGTDVDGDWLSFTVNEEPTSGRVECGAAGACTYDPDLDFSGTVTVGYQVSDGELTSAGVFTIIVSAVNDAPVASDSTVTTDEDSPVTLTLEAADADGDDLGYDIVTEPANGALECAPGGDTCVYTPADEFSGSDAFSWTASDDSTVSDTATVAITVLPVNDAPVALDVSADADEDTPVTFTLLATDVDDADVTFTVESDPANGSVTIDGDQATYVPDTDFEGVDTFTYRATDPSGASSVAQATVTVIGAPLLRTAIKAEAAVARVQVFKSQVLFPGMEARLWSEDGRGLAGREITFSAGGQVICTAITDADGVARCGGSAPIASILLKLGYTATFAGDADYLPISSKGPLIQILSFRL